ncbi:MAG TPA: YihY/virulence factor BrkB family protein [Bryobacteraceae bacterium]|nr:YihY/virulence factor BrkB family protein [Bryobacteraceae bacterium]
MPQIRGNSALARAGRVCTPTVRYWMETEVHVYGFSIAANVLLSFFPFLIVMVSLCKYLFQWPGAVDAIMFALNDYFPADMVDFIQRNLRATVNSRGPMQMGSILLLFFTANGIFEPMEVALNRAWGITQNRSFLKNQLVSMGLIFACGGLILASIAVTAANRQILRQSPLGQSEIESWLTVLFFKAAELPITILILFLIYWLLPNRRMPWRDVVPVSIFVGLALEGLKYINLLTWPYLRMKLEREYGPFINSVTIVLWSFLAAMVVLAGAEWAARRRNAALNAMPDLS